MKKQKKGPTRDHVARTVPPSVSQVEMIKSMNKELGTSYAIPKTETDARFLIDGMIDEERKRKRAHK